MFCIKCGKELKDDARFCKFCGARVPDDFVEIDNVSEQKEEDVQEKDDNSTELIVDEDRGAETVFIDGVKDNSPAEPDNGEDIEKTEESGSELEGASEDDGETEIVDTDNTASIMDNPQRNGDAQKKEPQKKEGHQEDKNKELKYMGHVLDENIVKQSSEESQKQGASKVRKAILILSIVLVILIMIAIGLGFYYYLDNKMLREKYAEELVLPDNEDKSTELDADDIDEEDIGGLFDDED